MNNSQSNNSRKNKNISVKSYLTNHYITNNDSLIHEKSEGITIMKCNDIDDKINLINFQLDFGLLQNKLERLNSLLPDNQIIRKCKCYFKKKHYSNNCVDTSKSLKLSSFGSQYFTVNNFTNNITNTNTNINSANMNDLCAVCNCHHHKNQMYQTPQSYQNTSRSGMFINLKTDRTKMSKFNSTEYSAKIKDMKKKVNQLIKDNPEKNSKIITDNDTSFTNNQEYSFSYSQLKMNPLRLNYYGKKLEKYDKVRGINDRPSNIINLNSSYTITDLLTESVQQFSISPIQTNTFKKLDIINNTLLKETKEEANFTNSVNKSICSSGSINLDTLVDNILTYRENQTAILNNNINSSIVEGINLIKNLKNSNYTTLYDRSREHSKVVNPNLSQRNSEFSEFVLLNSKQSYSKRLLSNEDLILDKSEAIIATNIASRNDQDSIKNTKSRNVYNTITNENVMISNIHINNNKFPDVEQTPIIHHYIKEYIDNEEMESSVIINEITKNNERKENCFLESEPEEEEKEETYDNEENENEKEDIERFTGDIKNEEMEENHEKYINYNNENFNEEHNQDNISLYSEEVEDIEDDDINKNTEDEEERNLQDEEEDLELNQEDELEELENDENNEILGTDNESEEELDNEIIQDSNDKQSNEEEVSVNKSVNSIDLNDHQTEIYSVTSKTSNSKENESQNNSNKVLPLKESTNATELAKNEFIKGKRVKFADSKLIISYSEKQIVKELFINSKNRDFSEYLKNLKLNIQPRSILIKETTDIGLEKLNNLIKEFCNTEESSPEIVDNKLNKKEMSPSPRDKSPSRIMTRNKEMVQQIERARKKGTLFSLLRKKTQTVPRKTIKPKCCHKFNKNPLHFFSKPPCEVELKAMNIKLDLKKIVNTDKNNINSFQNNSNDEHIIEISPRCYSDRLVEMINCVNINNSNNKLISPLSDLDSLSKSSSIKSQESSFEVLNTNNKRKQSN